ncbi:MAG: hypothetical protein WA655_04645 [Candidatus Korobacteraceae bacterium]
MYRNVNLDAHLSALLFLGSAGLLVLLLIAVIVTLFWRRQWLRYTFSALLVLIVGYGILLLGFSLSSRERALARGEEKYFCELDCHLAYAVESVQRVKTIGDTRAAGEFYVVTVRTRFDENTTAPWRPRDATVTPDPLDFSVVDGQGRSIQRSSAGQSAWDAMHGPSHSLTDPIRPGEAYETTLVFDVPPDAGAPRLLASFAVFPTQVLIGDENSLLHRKTYFAL